VQLIARRNGKEIAITVPLQSRFSNRFILINLLLGLQFWIVGIFVYLRKAAYRAARIFYWGCIALAFSILANWPSGSIGAGFMASLLHILYFCIYPLVPGFILGFTIIYPSERRFIHPALLRAIVFGPCIIMIAMLQSNYLPAIYFNSLSHHTMFLEFYTFFRLLLVIYIISSFGFLINSYKTAINKEHRDKIRWIFWGMAVGAVPFLFLWTIPLIFGIPPFIPEGLNYIFLFAVPLAFGFSIVKYQALDIEVVINRSIVYAVVTGIIVATYLVLVGMMGYFLHSLSPRTSNFLIIIFTLVASIAFSPLKQRIQTFVDKTFYRVKYNYRLAMKDFSETIRSVHDQNQLINLMIEKINNAIPIKKLAFLLAEATGKIFRIAANHGMNENDLTDLRGDLSEARIELIHKSRNVLVKAGSADRSDYPELPNTIGLERAGIKIVIPVMQQEQIVGMMLLGEKRSEARYSEEDLALLTAMAHEGFQTVERIRLQENMIIERAEKEKLQELSDLKSEFVSHVSHELRTPLTSIQWSIENLLDGIPEPPPPKIRKYLEGISSSSKHLARMIENLLDISRIEAGRIEIHAERLPIATEIQNALEQVQTLADRKAIRLETTIAGELWLRADRDCLKEILTNLLDNAIKYSPEKSLVQIHAKLAEKADAEKFGKNIGGMVMLSIIDNGIGIPKEKQAEIFERFVRVKTEKSAREKGLGLGLYIVKKLVELQDGTIWVESEPGKGSVFRFMLPSG
jgi:signal transduction histidine kinase